MRCTGIVVVVAVILVSGMAHSVVKPPEMFTVNVKTTAPWHVAYQKYTGPYSGIPDALNDIITWIRKYELVHVGPVLTEYYNNPMEVDSTKLEWAVMYPVLEPLKGFPKEAEGKITIRKLDPVQVAYTYHRGPYQEAGKTYMRLFQWISQNGYQIAGPMRELYWSDPGQTPKEDLISEIQMPVIK